MLQISTVLEMELKNRSFQYGKTFAVDFVEICKVYVGKLIKAPKRILNSDKICRS